MRKATYSIFCLVILMTVISEPVEVGARQSETTAEKLGHPRDSKLLIIHADDLALAHSVDKASFIALDRKAVSSASIMVPCPWFTEVAAYAKAHPEADLGVHLTMNSEWKQYRWGPQAPVLDVRGLLDPDGYLHASPPMTIKRARMEEVEREIRAQVEKVVKAGISPTHLDSHMGTLFSPEFFPAYVRVAREYRVPFFALRFVTTSAALREQMRDTDIIPDAYVMATESVKPENWAEYYAGIVRGLKPGLTELIVHLGYDDAELQAITEGHPAYGSAWRQRDFDVITSPEFRKVLAENHVILVGWREIQKILPRS
jgi:predicted glycoside hydrolase/deacetylase ChbG (UPF0249 family)